MKQETDMENLDELFERFRQAPESHVFVPLADACRKMDRIEEALEICAQGLERHPEYASGHVVKGKCLYDLGRHREARKTFEHVLSLDESNLVALSFLGRIEADLGNTKAAKSHLQHILALDPDNTEIQRILSRISEGDEIERQAAAVVIPDEDDEDGDAGGGTSDTLATTTLADIFAEQGYREKAIKIYEEILKEDPGNKSVARKIAALRGDDSEPTETAPTVSPREEHSEPPGRDEPDVPPPAARAGRAARPARPEVIQLGVDDDTSPEVLEREVDELLGGDEDVDVVAGGFREMSEEETPMPARPEREKSDKAAAGRKAAETRATKSPKTPKQVDAPRGDRRAIDERENLKHFQNWLKKAND